MYHRGEQYRISKKWNLYIFLQRNALIDIKTSIIDICNTNMAPISKTLMFYLLHEWKIQWKCESWKIYHRAGDSCPPNRYRSIVLRANSRLGEPKKMYNSMSTTCNCVTYQFQISIGRKWDWAKSKLYTVCEWPSKMDGLLINVYRCTKFESLWGEAFSI